MYADLVVTADTKEELQTRILDLQKCLEGRGLKVNAGKTEVMVCGKVNEKITVHDRHGTDLAQSTKFKYLGSTVETTGGCELEVNLRVSAAWKKWKEITPVICDKKMPIKLKTKLYKTVVRPVMLYGAETWSTRVKEVRLLEKTEMRMLRWIMGVSLRDRIRSEDIRAKLGVVNITEKLKEMRLRWYGHVQRSERYIKTALDMPVTGTRSRGRQRMRWKDCVTTDMRERGLTLKDAHDRSKWRRLSRVADTLAASELTA